MNSGSSKSVPADVLDRKRLPGGLERLAGFKHVPVPTIATGFDELSTHLPGHGWPIGALTELIGHAEGIGELSLIMPALAALGREGKRTVWVAPPYLPFAPVLSRHGLDLSSILVIQAHNEDENLWAAEQALRTSETGAVVLWPSRRLDERRSRRLQLAAETGRSVGFVFCPMERASSSSPAALRLAVKPARAGLSIEVLKCRGGRADTGFVIGDLHASAMHEGMPASS